MLDLIKKSLDAAIGGIALTQEKMKELADELVVKGHLSKKEGSDLLKELKSIAKDNQKKVGAVIEDQVRKVMKEIGVATTSDVKSLKGRISALEKELERAKKKAAPKKTKKS